MPGTGGKIFSTLLVFPCSLIGFRFSFVERAGRADGLLEGLSKGTQTETMIDIMVAEANELP